MKTENKWCYFTLLFVAGIVSLLSSLYGCLVIFGFLFQYPHFAKDLIPFLLLALEFPLFVLAVGVSRRFILVLWPTAFIYPFALIYLASDIFIMKSFLSLVAVEGTISFVLLATLLQFSARFKLLPVGTDSQGVKDESAV